MFTLSQTHSTETIQPSHNWPPQKRITEGKLCIVAFVDLQDYRYLIYLTQFKNWNIFRFYFHFHQFEYGFTYALKLCLQITQEL